MSTQVLEANEVETVDASKAKKAEKATKPLPPVLTPEQEAAKQDKEADLAKLEEARSAASHAVGSFETGTAIDVYVAIGETCWHAIYLAYMLLGKTCTSKKVPNSWGEKDYDSQVDVLRTRCMTFYPHLFLSQTDGRRDGVVAKVSNYILAYQVVKTLRETFGMLEAEISGISYHAVVNLIGRKMVTFSKVSMDCSMKPSWAEFIKNNLPRLHSASITYKDFVALTKEHEDKLSSGKKEEAVAGKTPAQLAQEKKEADARKKAASSTQGENKVRTDLSTSLSVAMAGGLKPDAIASIIAKSAEDANVPLSTFKLERVGLDPATCTNKEVLAIIKGMYFAERFAELRKLSTEIAKLVNMIDESETTDIQAAA